VPILTPIWCTYPVAGGDPFDFQSIFGSLPNIPLELIPAFIEMKKVVAETEARKAEAEAEARKAEEEIRKDDAKTCETHV
jgi:hypothetical protein